MRSDQQWVHASRTTGYCMEWTRVDVQSDEEMGAIGGLADLKVGLDTDAESMHRVFLDELPHLSEVI